MQLSEVLGKAELTLTNCGNFMLALDYHPKPNTTWGSRAGQSVPNKEVQGN